MSESRWIRTVAHHDFGEHLMRVQNFDVSSLAPVERYLCRLQRIHDVLTTRLGGNHNNWLSDVARTQYDASKYNASRRHPLCSATLRSLLSFFAYLA